MQIEQILSKIYSPLVNPVPVSCGFALTKLDDGCGSLLYFDEVRASVGYCVSVDLQERSIAFLRSEDIIFCRDYDITSAEIYPAYVYCEFTPGFIHSCSQIPNFCLINERDFPFQRFLFVHPEGCTLVQPMHRNSYIYAVPNSSLILACGTSCNFSFTLLDAKSGDFQTIIPYISSYALDRIVFAGYFPPNKLQLIATMQSVTVSQRACFLDVDLATRKTAIYFLPATFIWATVLGLAGNYYLLMYGRTVLGISVTDPATLIGWPLHRRCDRRVMYLFRKLFGFEYTCQIRSYSAIPDRIILLERAGANSRNFNVFGINGSKLLAYGFGGYDSYSLYTLALGVLEKLDDFESFFQEPQIIKRLDHFEVANEVLQTGNVLKDPIPNYRSLYGDYKELSEQF